ncbi:MAG: 1-phosphofructokinase family hexose kinase [Deltaproteobacteria bacterium]|jgi:tagatose 6-phosphate kinase|nr:1-phosphofructokinase family hexose kinase [Deltaproteobacteria bacterium]
MITTITLNPSVDKLYCLPNANLGSVMRLDSSVSTAGGKGLNVTRVLKKMDSEVLAIGIVGGLSGQFIEETLHQEGIVTDFTHHGAESRSCINLLETSSQRQTEFLEPGAEVSQDTLDDFYERFTNAVKLSRVVSMSGSLPKGVPLDYYAFLTRRAKSFGAKVIVDTSGPALAEALDSAPEMVKPNLAEASQLLNRQIQGLSDIVKAALEFVKCGVAIASISLGAKGVVAATSDEIFHVFPPEVAAVNTVGCGDSFVAAVAYGMDTFMPLEETLKYACAISAASSMTMETGNYRIQDLSDIWPHVTLNKIGKKALL